MVWADQVRYVSFDGHFSLSPLRTKEAHPQGGPWGPPAMQIWMIVGVIATREMDWNRWTEKRRHNAKSAGPRKGKEGEQKVGTKRTAEEGPSGKRRKKEDTASGCLSKKRRREEEEEVEQEPKRYNATTKAYIVDRNIVTNNADALLDGIETWQKWSTSAELQENAAKTQIVAKGATERKNWRLLWRQGRKGTGVKSQSQRRRCSEQA